jgi:aspartate aminotransferase-like enzyme
MINHRGAEFKQLLKSLSADLKGIFQTESDVLLLAASGTGGLEAAIVNAVAPGEGVLAVSTGFFGERFATIAETCGAQVHRLDFPWGQGVDAAAVRQRLQMLPGVKAVLVTHNETSTGVTNDLQSIAAAVHAPGATSGTPLLLVDAVSSLAAIDLPTDAWGCDIVITCSQKALMASPGLALLSVGPRAWAAIEAKKCRSYYFDLRSMRKRAQEGETPATPPVSDLFGLSEGVRLILGEGLPNVFARHHRVAERMRQGVRDLGLELFPDRRWLSDTVTAVRLPDADAVRARLREQGVVVAGGQGPLKGQIIRVGHMGFVSEQDIDQVIDALKKVTYR